MNFLYHTMASPMHYGGEMQPRVDHLFSGNNPDSVDVKRNSAKLDRLKKKVRDREVRLSMSRKDIQERVLSGESKPFESRPENLEEENSQGDAKGDAVKALSFATLQLRRQVDKKSEEASRLRTTLHDLETSLKARDKEKEELEVDLRVYRRSVEAHSEHIERLCRQLESKDSYISKLAQEKGQGEQNVEDLKAKLAAARKDFEWVREESISKGEQIEYFEYELLSKNDEIDKLRQDLDKKLRRIVELEVDLIIVDCHNSLKSKKQAAIESSGNKTKALQASDDELPSSEAHNEKRTGIRRLLDLTCQPVMEERPLPAEWARSEWSIADTLTTATTDTASTSTLSSPRRLSRGKSGTNSLCEQYVNIIENLRSEVAEVEERYKQDKYDSSKLIEELRQENNEYLIKLVCMESHLKQNDPKVTSFDSDLLRDLDELDHFAFETSDESEFSGATLRDAKLNVSGTGTMHSNSLKLPNKFHFLEQKIETLEGEGVLNQRAVENLKIKCAELERQARITAKQDKRVIVNLTLQNEAQSLKIAELERQLCASGHRKAGKECTEYVASLEARVQAQFSELARLRRENDLKDYTIEALRSDLIDQRSKQALRKSHAASNVHFGSMGMAEF